MSFVCIALQTSHTDFRFGWSDSTSDVSWHWILVDFGLIIVFFVKKNLEVFRCIRGLLIYRIVDCVTCLDSVAVPTIEGSSRTPLFLFHRPGYSFPVDRCVLRLCVLWRQWETQICGPNCDHNAEENVFCSFPYITSMHQAPASFCVPIGNF